MDKINLMLDLTRVARNHGLDIEANMEDFIIARFWFDCFNAMGAANKANGEYFVLSAEADEIGGEVHKPQLTKGE